MFFEVGDRKGERRSLSDTWSMLPGLLRLKNPLSFQKAFRYGKPFFFGNIGSRIVFQTGNGRKIGFVVAKKMFHHAVDRNRVKRIFSEATHPLSDAFPEDASIVLFLRKRPEAVELSGFQNDIRGLIRAINMSFQSKKQV
jgi:ribonuclease P protein component